MTESGHVPPTSPPLPVEAVDFTAHQGGRKLLDHITLTVRPNRIMAIIGPAVSGKSMFLKCINRLCELDGMIETSGQLRVFGQNVYDAKTDVLGLRRQVGMIFSRPSLPTQTIFDNVALAPRLLGLHDKARLAEVIERCLQQVGLWDQLADRLSEAAAGLPAQAQQRLCIARVLAAEPRILLFDEPTAHLDYPSAGHLEDLICELAKRYPVIIAAQTPQQAAHIAVDTAFFWEGRLVESGPTDEVLTNPKDPRTEAYVTGRFT